MKPDRKSIYEAIMRDVREEFLGTSRVNEDLLDDMSVERSMDAAQRIVTRESLQQLAGEAVA